MDMPPPQPVEDSESFEWFLISESLRAIERSLALLAANLDISTDLFRSNNDATPT